MKLPALPAENRALATLIDTDDDQDWWDQALIRKHLAEMHDEHRDRVERLKRRKTLTVGTIYRRVRGGQSSPRSEQMD